MAVNSVSDSEEERVPTKIMRSSEEQQAAGSIPHYDVASTSSAIHLDERPNTSSDVSVQSPRIRADISLPEALLNLVWLPLNSLPPTIPPIFGAFRQKLHFTPIDFLHLFFSEAF